MGLKHGIIFTTHRSNNRRSNQSQVCANSFLFLCIFHQHVLEDDQIICTRTNMYWMINMYWMMNGYSMMIIIYIYVEASCHMRRESGCQVRRKNLWAQIATAHCTGNCTVTHSTLHWKLRYTLHSTVLNIALRCTDYCTALTIALQHIALCTLYTTVL